VHPAAFHQQRLPSVLLPLRGSRALGGESQTSKGREHAALKQQGPCLAVGFKELNGAARQD